jgi:hypothetical protein
MAIRNSRQQWVTGSIVKVGFLQLRVLGVQAVYDGKPDIYSLESLDGSRQYEFIPHHGIQRI